MKKLLCMAVSIAIALSLSAVGCPALAVSDEINPVTLMVYTPAGEDSPALQTLREYADLVSDASENLITLDIHHSGELGDSSSAISAVQSGSIDIVLADTSSLIGYYEPARMLSLPFLFDRAEQAYEAANGKAGEQIFASLPDIGLVFLAEGDGSMRQIAANRPIRTAKDVEGLMINIPDNFLCWDVWGTLAAAPTALASADVPAAVAGGTLQAMDGSAFEMEEDDNYEGLTDLSVINYMWSGSTMLININTWNDLPLEAQEILKEEAVEAVKVSFDAVAEAEAAALDALADDGLEINSEPNIQSFRRALGGDTYYDRYIDSAWCPGETLAALLEAID